MRRFTSLVTGLFVLVAQSVYSDAPNAPKFDDAFRRTCYAHLSITGAMASEGNDRLQALNNAIALEPSLARAYYNRGNALIDSGKTADAKADYESAIRIKPDFINAHYNLACVYCRESAWEAALDSLERALANGYLKLDNITADPDLGGLRDNPALVKLLAKYREQAGQRKLSVMQQIQVAQHEQKTQLLEHVFKQPDETSVHLASWLMTDPDPSWRVVGLQLMQRLDDKEAKMALVMGLYDSHGGVNKSAANSLVGYGREIESAMSWVMDDEIDKAPFYAMQVIAKIKGVGSINKIERFLENKNAKTRIIAAQSLAELGAVRSIPLIEKALLNLPEPVDERDFYRVSLNASLHHLKAVENSANQGKES